MSLTKDCDLLVFSAHAADFCSRAGGAIAASCQAGQKVHVVDLTCGERGESEDYWTGPAPISHEDAARVRAAEASEAAATLGATIEFLHFRDYPLTLDADRLACLSGLIRTLRPSVILTHWLHDPWNVDHEETARAVRRAVTMAAVPGVDPSTPPFRWPAIYAFEPTIPLNDETAFRPTHYFPIDDVFEVKMQALSKLRSQSKLARTYTMWGEYRGAQARQWSGLQVRYAEAYHRLTATVSRDFMGA